jgi:SAM-dependent methyltransferase
VGPMKVIIKKIPVVGDLARHIYRKVKTPAPPEPAPVPFDNSADYWETRYATGGNSGVGSYDKFAKFKAEALNEFVRVHGVQTVLEFGCGDGNQLALARYPRYTGYDVSATAVAMCRKRFAADSTKTFRTTSEYAGDTADLALSLDVIFHLVEDTVFESYMRTLFGASRRYVIIYSSDTDENEGYAGTHVWHRKFTQWVDANRSQWKLIQHIPNRYPYHGDYTLGSFADFFIYEIG